MYEEFVFKFEIHRCAVAETGKENITLGYANNIVTKVKRFCDLKSEDLILEHDEECQTLDGLRKAMIRAYGDGFEDTEIVTIVQFDFEPRNHL